ncbi:hypothetical protein PS925_06171 [Pseudomonas fluorescens]|uniref:Uncharacterized protein n=1 Tax=Pseudomonas fluorescens TaxID=294 RepID=A0A5E7VUF2_PSEFL|nr:hypothetical protein PS925_06171 [Pseudomonas fluorescens]
MLGVQRFGDVVLIAGFLGLKLFGLHRKTVLLIARGGEAFGGFRQILVMFRLVRTRLSGDQKTRPRTHCAVAVGA